jgi:hypothetical protein
MVTQTVDIPANSRLTLEVPPEVPVGRAILTFTPAVLPKEEAGIRNDPLSAREALEMGRGIAKRLGSHLSSDRFLEMRRGASAPLFLLYQPLTGWHFLPLLFFP